MGLFCYLRVSIVMRTRLIVFSLLCLAACTSKKSESEPPKPAPKPNDQPDYQTMSRIKEASMQTGYAFRLRDFRIKKGVGAIALVENAGVAHIYRDARVAVGTARSEFSLRELTPGEQKWIPVSCPDVSVNSVPGIFCSHLVPGQEITFVK